MRILLISYLIPTILFGNIIRYEFNNQVYIIDPATTLHHKVKAIDHEELEVLTSCLVKYRNRLVYSVNPKSGKMSRVSIVNHENISTINGCIIRNESNKTVYSVEPETGRAYKVKLPIHGDIAK